MNISKHWYSAKPTALTTILYPFSALFGVLSFLNRLMTKPKATKFKVPVIVVGNITVGGTGKTPFIQWLCNELKQQGIRPGIVSRGYGANLDAYPSQLPINPDPFIYGDEPSLLAQNTGVPVVIDPDRAKAVNYLIDQNNVNLIISDDGMQHYKMWRDMEIAMVDGTRLFGNGWLLPAGPLRERPNRLNKVDLIISKGHAIHHFQSHSVMELNPQRPVNPDNPNEILDNKESITVIAGIGNPESFFNLVKDMGYQIEGREFPDHHSYSIDDFLELQDSPIIMTEKDYIKCQHLNLNNLWVVKIEPDFDAEFKNRLHNKIRNLMSSQ